MKNGKYTRDMIEGWIPAYAIGYAFGWNDCGMSWASFLHSGGPTMYSRWRRWYEKCNVTFPYREEEFGFLVKTTGLFRKTFIFSYPEPEKAGNRIADVIIVDSRHGRIAILGIIAMDGEICSLWGRDEKGYYYLIDRGTREAIYRFISRKRRLIMRLIGTDWAFRQQYVVF